MERKKVDHGIEFKEVAFVHNNVNEKLNALSNKEKKLVIDSINKIPILIRKNHKRLNKIYNMNMEDDFIYAIRFNRFVVRITIIKDILYILDFDYT